MKRYPCNPPQSHDTRLYGAAAGGAYATLRLNQIERDSRKPRRAEYVFNQVHALTLQASHPDEQIILATHDLAQYQLAHLVSSTNPYEMAQFLIGWRAGFYAVIAQHNHYYPEPIPESEAISEE